LANRCTYTIDRFAIHWSCGNQRSHLDATVSITDHGPHIWRRKTQQACFDDIRVFSKALGDALYLSQNLRIEDVSIVGNYPNDDDCLSAKQISYSILNLDVRMLFEQICAVSYFQSEISKLCTKQHGNENRHCEHPDPMAHDGPRIALHPSHVFYSGLAAELGTRPLIIALFDHANAAQARHPKLLTCRKSLFPDGQLSCKPETLSGYPY